VNEEIPKGFYRYAACGQQDLAVLELRGDLFRHWPDHLRHWRDRLRHTVGTRSLQSASVYIAV